MDAVLDTACGSGYCIASINGGEFPDCVQGKCCPSAAQETLCNGKCMDFGETCCKDNAVCGFFERCLDLKDGTCIENDCEAILKYDHGATGDVVTPEVPSCLTRSGCAAEIVEQGGMQCVRAKATSALQADSSVCTTGGYENTCLSDDESKCDFVNLDLTSPLGECAAAHLSAEGAAAVGLLVGGALIAVIVVPILAVLCCGGILARLHLVLLLQGQEEAARRRPVVGRRDQEQRLSVRAFAVRPSPLPPTTTTHPPTHPHTHTRTHPPTTHGPNPRYSRQPRYSRTRSHSPWMLGAPVMLL